LEYVFHGKTSLVIIIVDWQNEMPITYTYAYISYAWATIFHSLISVKKNVLS
jgi:hypothetical protein